MKKILFYSLVILFCGVGTSLSAQQSKKISLQGFLKDANGKAVEDGMQEITFKLYTDATTTTVAWTDVQDINVFGGVYSTQLGSVANPLDGLNWGSSTYFVGVTVQGIELTPRTELTFAPYSLGSPKAQEVVCSGAVGDVKYSILNPTQFALQNGDCWVPMDGTSIAGSKLAAILTANSQSTTIVNAGGLFIRGNEFSSNSNYDPERSYSTTVMPNIQGEAFASHGHFGTTSTDGIHSHSGTTDGGGFGGTEIVNGGTGAVVANEGGNHNHNFTTNSAGNHYHNVNVNPAGGNETRPDNMNLWTYIRIN